MKMEAKQQKVVVTDEAPLEHLRALTEDTAESYAAHKTIVSEKNTADAELLYEVIKIVGPALPSICTEGLFSLWYRPNRLNDGVAELFIRANGELLYTSDGVESPQPVTEEFVTRTLGVRVPRIMESLCTAMAQQNRDAATEKLALGLEKVRAILALLK